MPVYGLSNALIFPHPTLSNHDGILAVGGDLSVKRLLLAYKFGIFPWYNQGEPVIWHAPNPRFVLFPERFKVSKSLKQLAKQNKYTITLNKNFLDVITHCATIKRKNQKGTWIINEMLTAYKALHQTGFAHSVEVWNKNNQLVGGLYGVNLGTVFYGESMFSKESNTSKLALYWLLKQYPFKVVDCQVETKHLASLGAENIALNDFLEILRKETLKNNIL